MSSNLTRNPNLDLDSIEAESQISEAWRRNLGRSHCGPSRDASWWTGPNPASLDCPGRQDDGSIAALETPDLARCTRKDVQAYFDNGWVLTELLFAGLAHEEAFYRPPYHALRHPLVFYYVHPAVLYVNKLLVAGLLDQTPNPYFERIFETGVDEMSWDDLSKNEMQWPDLEACRDYRRQVYTIMRGLLAHHPGLADQHPPITMDSPLWSLFMGFEHERIHLETSSVLMRELPLRLLLRPAHFPPFHPSARLFNTEPKKKWQMPIAGQDYPQNSWVDIAGGTVRIGKEEAFPSYGWDNEYGRDDREVQNFRCQSHTVSNGEFYEFVRSGGYRESRWWSEDGWSWRCFRNIKWPSFWTPIGPQGAQEYALRNIFELVEMPWSWPVVVNNYEAKAYAAWRTHQEQSKSQLRLLTEAEHHRLRRADGIPASSLSHLRFGSEGPVTLGADEKLAGIFGNVWQWLEDHFHPLSGFKVHPYYDDFSTPCFDGRHHMIMGGSFISVGDEATVHARFHFRPHFFQHAGFRLVDPLSNHNDGAVQQIGKNQTPFQFDSDSAASHSPFEWTAQQLDQGLQSLSEAVGRWWDQMSHLPPAGANRSPVAQSMAKPSHELPERGEELSVLLELLMRDLGRSQEIVGHPGYMAYVAGAAQPVAAIAQALAMLLNPYTGTFETAPAAFELEHQVIHWLLQMMGMPEQGGGLITSGSSMAIFSAVIAAREAHKAVPGQRRVYVSDQAHHAIGKALFGAGFLDGETVVLPSVDGRLVVREVQDRIQSDRAKGLQPLMLFATAGTTNTGRVDPLDALATVAAAEKLWFHVDAAYGGFFRLLPEAVVLNGIERADSLSLDPHKSLYMPYGTGVLLVRDKHCLRWPRGLDSSYMPAEDTKQPARNLTDLSPELSRDFRGLRLWLSLKVFGLGAYRQQLAEKWQLARHLAEQIKAEPDLELSAEPDLSILNFRIKGDPDDQRTAALLKAINSSGRYYLTSCSWKKHLQIRVCILGFRTHGETIAGLMNFIRETLPRI